MWFVTEDSSQNFYGYHEVFYSQPPSSSSFDPPDCIVLCSPILDSTSIIHEDEVVDGVGVEKPTYAVIFYEYVWKSK